MAEIPAPHSATVAAIYRHHEQNQGEDYDSYGIPFSELGQECDRRIWYSYRWAYKRPAKSGLNLRRLESGRREEDRIIAELKAIGCEIADQQQKATLCGGHVRGKIEGSIANLPDAPATVHTLEIKTLKATDWRAIAKHGLAKAKPEHWIQVICGMRAKGHVRGLYVGQNQDTSELLTERVKVDAVTAMQIEARADRIIAAEEPPAKLHEDPSRKAAFKCGFCPAKDVCHGGRFARIHCRTCIHASPVKDGHGSWHCARHDVILTRDQQRKGCAHHLFIPVLVPGDQIDVDASAETVTYRIGEDAALWIDRAGLCKDDLAGHFHDGVSLDAKAA